MHNLKDIILLHLKAAKQAGKDSDKVTIDMYMCYAISAYLLFLVGTTIFSNEAKNYVDITYLKYLKDLKLIDDYAWGPTALKFLYRELKNVIAPTCKYLAGYLTLQQSRSYHNFEDIGGVEDSEYKEHIPQATKFVPIKGQTNMRVIRKLMDPMMPHNVNRGRYLPKSV
ncbi:hypothetical protein TSUD_242540 [Trifolium subterraneum]|uniref:Aminotransferase-like plant mobile domain-containing protein n=1 Tax=Trifolium subterraneum TaxID=3900 RepID=A0A2Z6M8D9_TRISU|nr:hypothetical protein TSUD_242540 [Trifolium subterraneum]